MFSERNKPTTAVPKTVKVKQLQKELKTETSKWKELGFQLLLSPDDLRKIERDANKKSPRMCLQEAIEYWLTNGEDRTWEVIFDALEDDHGRLKSELENQFHADMEVARNSTQLINLLDEVVPDWYMFGQNIDVPLKELKSFKDAKAPDQCFSEMLSKWLNSGKATWEGLVEALIQINNRRLAKEIEKKYIKYVPDDKVKGQRPMWYVGLDEQELEEEEHYLNVLHAVNSVVKWEELGLALKLKSYRLEEIRKDENTTADRRKKMLSTWLREGEATWKSLCLALDNDLVGEKKLARDIAKEHKVGDGGQGSSEAGIPLPLVNIAYPQQVSSDDLQQGHALIVHDSGSMQQMSHSESSNPQPSAPLEEDMDTTSSTFSDYTIQMSQPGIGGQSSLPSATRPSHVTNPSVTSHVTSHVTNPSMSGHAINPSMPGMPAMPSMPSHHMGHASMEQDMGLHVGGHNSFVHNNYPIPNQQDLPPGNPVSIGSYQLPGQALPQQDLEQGGHHSFVRNNHPIPNQQDLPPGNPVSIGSYQIPGQAMAQQDIEQGGHHSFVRKRQDLPPGNPVSIGSYQIPGQAMPQQDIEQGGHHSFVRNNHPVPSQQDLPPGNPVNIGSYQLPGQAVPQQDIEQGGHHSFVRNNHPIPNQQHLDQQPGRAVFEQDMEQDGHHSKSPSTGQKDIQASSDNTQAELVHNNQYDDYKVYQNTSSVFTTAHSIEHN